MLRYFLIIQY